MERPPKRRRTALLDELDSSSDLDRDRHRNDNRLKGALENIFLKYTKDFSNVGDEIDLETGEIVINNGHISRMRDEQDVGEGKAGAILRAFAEDMVDSSSEDDGTKKSQSKSSIKSRFGQDAEVEDPAMCNVDCNEENEQPTAADQEEIHTRARMEPQRGPSAPVERRKPDTAAFEALGQSIALQIAQFIDQWNCGPPALGSLWAAPPLLQRTPACRDVSESLQASRQRRPVSPPTGSLWAVPDPSIGVRPIQQAVRPLETRPHSLSKDAATPHRDSHGEDQEYTSGEDNDDDSDNGEGNKRNFPTYLDRSRQAYSANTSAKRAGSGRKSRHHFSEEDNNLLVELKEEHQFPWATIWSYWPDRPPWIVQHHYHKHLKNRDSGLAHSVSAQPEEVGDRLDASATSRTRASSRASEASQVLAPEATENSDAVSSPAQSRQRPFRRIELGSTLTSSRDTVVDHTRPDFDQSDLTVSTAGGITSRISECPETLDRNELPEIADSQDSIESRSSPEILESVEPGGVQLTHKTNVKDSRSSKKKQYLGLAPGKSSTESLGGCTPPKVKNKPRTERTVFSEDGPNDELSGSDESNLINISNLVASPQTSRHRKHTIRRSGSKFRHRRVSDARASLKSQHASSRTSELKRTFDMYDDDDDSLDELALV